MKLGRAPATARIRIFLGFASVSDCSMVAFWRARDGVPREIRAYLGVCLSSNYIPASSGSPGGIEIDLQRVACFAILKPQGLLECLVGSWSRKLFLFKEEAESFRRT